MSEDELVLGCMQEERDEFEQQVFQMLFGADARPPMAVEEYGEAIPRVFSYEDAREALAEASKSLELLFKIKEHYECPENEEDDTQEAFEFRESLQIIEDQCGGDA